MYATGTVECITPAFSEAVFTEELRRSNLCTYDHAAPDMYATVAFSLTGGNILKWFRDEFGSAEAAEARAGGVSPYELLLKQASPSPTSLLVLPYFTPSGTPYFDTKTKGAILGLTLSTRRGEFLRALLEGVAFEMRLNLDILERSGCRVQELRAIGGGAKSPFWTQLKADVMGKPITTLDVTEAGCLGVAMLACAADTGRPVRELAREWVRPAATCRPEPAAAEFYRGRFDAYRRMYPAVRALTM
jgi:xylulokinase